MTAYSGKALLALWVAAVIAAAIALMILFGGFAGAADLKDCHAYANRASAFGLRQLLGQPWVDVATGRFLYRKSYSFCLLQDELPVLAFTPEEQPIIDGLPAPKPRPEPPPGSVPATDAADTQEVMPAAPKGEPLCIKNGMRTVYHGRHWRCRK